MIHVVINWITAASLTAFCAESLTNVTQMAATYAGNLHIIIWCFYSTWWDVWFNCCWSGWLVNRLSLCCSTHTDSVVTDVTVRSSWCSVCVVSVSISTVSIVSSIWNLIWREFLLNNYVQSKVTPVFFAWINLYNMTYRFFITRENIVFKSVGDAFDRKKRW